MNSKIPSIVHFALSIVFFKNYTTYVRLIFFCIVYCYNYYCVLNYNIILYICCNYSVVLKSNISNIDVDSILQNS